MTDAVEKMAYAGEVPWHGLGNAVSDKLSPAQMLKAAGLDWTVSKRPMFFAGPKGDTKMYPSSEDLALVRDSDNYHLSTVGTKYKPIQNADALDFFSKFTKAGKMNMETAGSLWHGRWVWGLARVGHDFALGKGSKADEVRSYLLFASPHVHGKSAIIQYTSVRVVCWNTLSMALGAKMKGKGNPFRMPHSQEFNEHTRKAAEDALGLALEQSQEFKVVAELLAKKKAPAPKVEEYFAEILRFDPAKADKKKDGEVKEPRMLPKFRHALEHAPGNALPSAQGTWWGALNAVTYVIDHETGTDRNTALRNAWLGHTANLKREALKVAIERAK